MKSENNILIFLFVICALLLSCSACTSKDDYIGSYTSIDKGDATEKENIIILMKSGEGLWRCCEEDTDEEVAFSWNIKGKELRIYTKNGGVMTGKLQKNSFVMALPERKALTFYKTSSEN